MAIAHSCLQRKETDRKTLKEVIELAEASLKNEAPIFLSADLIVSNVEALPEWILARSEQPLEAWYLSNIWLMAFVLVLISLFAGMYSIAWCCGLVGKASPDAELTQSSISRELAEVESA